MMADQLLEKVREAAEGQIVSDVQIQGPVILAPILTRLLGLRRSKAGRAHGNGSTCYSWRMFLSYIIHTTIHFSCQFQAVAFIVGYILQDIKLALYIGLGGAAFTFIVVVPPWPFFNRNPIKWLPVAGSEIAPQGITVDRKVVG
jgi:hypothetical protein